MEYLTLISSTTALTAFLEGSDASANRVLPEWCFPSRVDRKPESRRRWLRAVLHAFLRTGEPNPTPPGCTYPWPRPGVVALLMLCRWHRLLPLALRHVPLLDLRASHTSFRESGIRGWSAAGAGRPWPC